MATGEDLTPRSSAMTVMRRRRPPARLRNALDETATSAYQASPAAAISPWTKTFSRAAHSRGPLERVKLREEAIRCQASLEFTARTKVLTRRCVVEQDYFMASPDRRLDADPTARLNIEPLNGPSWDDDAIDDPFA